MYTIISIEGIDRIGKSTFIDALQKKLDSSILGKVTVEKPTIGINTLHKNKYPLRDIRGIMEIRNIGLFEELLFQVQQHITNDLPDKCVIRDRFHLSELAYGAELRPEHFATVLGHVEGYEIYSEWTRWFEYQLKETGCIVKQIVFVLDSDSLPNEDEAVSSNRLIPINKNFRKEYNSCTFDKKLIILHKSGEYTDIMSYLDEVVNFVLDSYSIPSSKICYIKNEKLYVNYKDIHTIISDVRNGYVYNVSRRVDVNMFVKWFEKTVNELFPLYDKIKHGSIYNYLTMEILTQTWNTLPIFMMNTILGCRIILHIDEFTFSIGYCDLLSINSGNEPCVVLSNGKTTSFIAFSEFILFVYPMLKEMAENMKLSVSNKEIQKDIANFIFDNYKA